MVANSVAEPTALPPHRSQSHATDLTASMATGNSRQPGDSGFDGSSLDVRGGR